MRPEEKDAVAAARARIAACGVPGRRQVAAVGLTRRRRPLGLDPGCRLTRAAIRTAAAGLSSAARAGQAAELMVRATIGPDGAVLPPCGACRELHADLALGMRIAVPDIAAGIRSVPLAEPFPHAYRAAERGLS